MFNLKHDPITRDRILSQLTEEEIFEKYLGIKPEYDKPFCNPKRTDHTPGCWFYIDDRGRIKFIDHAHGFNWDCFNVVEHSFKTNFSGALKQIAADFGITNNTGHVVVDQPKLIAQRKRKERFRIRIKRRNWNEVDKNYWYGRYTFASKYLEFLRISPVSHAWWMKPGSDVLEPFYTYRPSDPCYAYYFPSYGEYEYKLYFPFREKGNRFRQTNGEIIQGLDLLPPTGHILIITKSFKDVAAIGLFSDTFKVYSIAPMSESQVIPRHVYEDLERRFDYIFTLFDFDRAGIKLMRKYEKEYNTPWLMFGSRFKKLGIKDIADHVDITKNGLDLSTTFNLFKELYEQRIG